ncbi:MAG: hypothetical protein IPK13_07935 [Deltaproteobacteria bacterium]|nr:hypothetical protein [Deltaproteobacteria bacterium]
MRIRGYDGRTLLVRLFVSYFIAAIGCHLASDWIARGMKPAFSQGIRLAPGDLELKSMRISDGKLHARIGVRWTHQEDGGVIRDTATITKKTAVYLVVPTLVFAVIFSLWGVSFVERAIAFGLGAIATVFVQMFDLPWLFASAIAGKTPPGVATSTGWMDSWVFFLENGGRQLIALVAAGCSLWAAAQLSQWLQYRAAEKQRRVERLDRRKANRQRARRAAFGTPASPKQET